MLHTERLLLRPWREADAESVYEYAKDPDVGPIAGWPPHKSVEESLDVIKNVLMDEESYAICEKENGKAIGAIALKLNDKGEIMKLEGILTGAANNTATMGYQGFGVNNTTFYASVGCAYGYLSDMDGLNVAISDKPENGTKQPYVLSDSTVTFIYHVHSGELEKSSVSVLPKYLYGNDPNARVALISRGAGPYQIYIYDFN